MKKILFLAFIIFCLSSFLVAHPASEVIIEYDAANKTIKVDVKHDLTKSPVQDVKKHYIKLVTLIIDGKQVNKESFDSQATIEDQLTNFTDIVLKKGSKVVVKTFCNLGGTKSGSLTIK